MKVFGIGLPRTGTTSLAEALSMLGFCSNHSCCILQNNNEVQEETALVDNALYRTYTELPEDSLFILTVRESDQWKKSIARFDNVPDDIPDMNEYINEAVSYFKNVGLENRLLVINIFEENNVMDKLSSFLCINPIFDSFPHKNGAIK